MSECVPACLPAYPSLLESASDLNWRENRRRLFRQCPPPSSPMARPQKYFWMQLAGVLSRSLVPHRVGIGALDFLKVQVQVSPVAVGVTCLRVFRLGIQQFLPPEQHRAACFLPWGGERAPSTMLHFFSPSTSSCFIFITTAPRIPRSTILLSPVWCRAATPLSLFHSAGGVGSCRSPVLLVLTPLGPGPLGHGSTCTPIPTWFQLGRRGV